VAERGEKDTGNAGGARSPCSRLGPESKRGTAQHRTLLSAGFSRQAAPARVRRDRRLHRRIWGRLGEGRPRGRWPRRRTSGVPISFTKHWRRCMAARISRQWACRCRSTSCASLAPISRPRPRRLP